jgi:hypothetical protein
MTSRKIQYWVIPPKADAEFVAAMEAVLDTYEKPYDPSHPVLSMDEQPVQLIKETRRRGGTRSASTASTSGPARRASSCSPNRWPAGGKRRREPRRRNWTGPSKRPACWRDVTATARL